MPLTPTAAIVGRPNVGKSTLFNRLLGRRQAIVHNRPGVTRDRLTGLAQFDERKVQLVDTGGLLAGDDRLGLNHQVMAAVAESDVLLLVVDGKEGLLPADQEVWERLRPSGKPTLLVVNKGDTREAQDRFGEFYRLGVERQLLVSAEHGLGIEPLWEALVGLLPAAGESAAGDEEEAAVAIVGRPNVGKSSLLNGIVGSPRALVSAEAGTTRDPVDTVVSRNERRYRLIDTAGIRRRSQTADVPEELAVMMARRQIERAEVAILVVDASQGITSGDLAVAGSIWELGRASVVAVNKWDLLKDAMRDGLEAAWPRLDEALAFPPRVNVSALTGRGLERLFGQLDRSLEAHRRKLPTAEVNRLFEQAVRQHHPPALGGKPWKLFYATQVGTRPPTFMLFASRPLPRRHAYRRYLENRVREALKLPGIPVRLVIRQR